MIVLRFFFRGYDFDLRLVTAERAPPVQHERRQHSEFLDITVIERLIIVAFLVMPADPHKQQKHKRHDQRHSFFFLLLRETDVRVQQRKEKKRQRQQDQVQSLSSNQSEDIPSEVHDLTGIPDQRQTEIKTELRVQTVLHHEK